MQVIKLGGREIQLVGSPMTPFLYKKEFNQSMTGDVMNMMQVEKNPALFDDINILQMIWAMENTTKMGKLEKFETWLSKFDEIDIFEIVDVVLEEALNATFRGNKGKTGKWSV